MRLPLWAALLFAAASCSSEPAWTGAVPSPDGQQFVSEVYPLLLFALGGMKDSVAPLILLVLIQQMLKSTTTVLTVFIFLGLLHEHRHGFDTRAFTPQPADAAR